MRVLLGEGMIEVVDTVAIQKVQGAWHGRTSEIVILVVVPVEHVVILVFVTQMIYLPVMVVLAALLKVQDHVVGILRLIHLKV